MITLSIPSQINSVLGGNAPVAFDKLIVTDIRMDPVTKNIDGKLLLTSTANTQMQSIEGVLVINTPQAFLRVAVPPLDFYRRINLTGPQLASIATMATNSQNSIESGLVSLGLIDGTQSTGV